jgi:hypothetical protein
LDFDLTLQKMMRGSANKMMRGSVEISLLYRPMFMSFSGKFWCLTRMVYLPMAYLYGKKFIGPITPTVLALREEIHDTPYGKIDWSNARNKCAKVCHIPCGSTVHYHHICPSILWDCI